jgi:hypothetical protein
MQQETHQLEYRAEPTYRRRSRLWFGLGLAIVVFILFGLRKLETMPYRPPYDMSTFLGGPELALVRALELLFAVVWCVLLIAFVVTFRPPRPSPPCCITKHCTGPGPRRSL